jgi:hypothetical protein
MLIGAPIVRTAVPPGRGRSLPGTDVGVAGLHRLRVLLLDGHGKRGTGVVR